MQPLIDMVEVKPKRWVAKFVIEKRDWHRTYLYLGAVAATYALAFLTLWLTGFR
jgi:hypothetical protein